MLGIQDPRVYLERKELLASQKMLIWLLDSKHCRGLQALLESKGQKEKWDYMERKDLKESRAIREREVMQESMEQQEQKGKRGILG